MLPACSRTSSIVLASLTPPALPRPPDFHLGLHDHGVAHALGDSNGFLNRVGDVAGRDGNAEAREVLLALILKEIHVLLLSLFGG